MAKPRITAFALLELRWPMENFGLLGSLILHHQGDFDEYAAGLFANFFLKNDSSIAIGSNARLVNTRLADISPALKLFFKQYKLELSYDLNFTIGKTGAWEASFVSLFRKAKAYTYKCPKF